MLLLIAANPYEFKGFSSLEKQSSGDVRWLSETKLLGAKALLAANGIGCDAAREATESLIAAHPVKVVISTGFAGALHPAYGVGDIFLADEILGGKLKYSGRLPAEYPQETRRGTLITVNAIVQSSQEKQTLATKGAQAVDMEAAAVAAVAQKYNLPFFCLRSISDLASQEICIDFNQALRKDGTISTWNVLKQAGIRMGYWSQLWQLKRDGRTAAQSLANCLLQCRFSN